MSLLALAAALGCRGEDPAPTNQRSIMVFAAASLAPALPEVLAGFEATHGCSTRASFAASSMLARQIEAGAPADVFISAHSEWIAYLADRELIDERSKRVVVGNSLAVIVPRTASPSVTVEASAFLESLGGRLAVADTTHVPAGRYAREALIHHGLWEQIQELLIPARDVRAAFQLVAIGEAEAGIVYRSDALGDDRVRMLYEFARTAHAPIQYWAAVCAGAAPDAKLLADYLMQPEVRAIFRRYGFVIPGLP